MRVWFLAMPESVGAEIDPAHIFVARREDRVREITALRGLLAPAGFVWVSWPKKASRVPTDIIEDTNRNIALLIGLVDIEARAVDGIWSGLKLVIRKALREA